MTVESPALYWDPGWLQATQPMTAEGEIPGSPFGSFDAALAGWDARRRDTTAATPADNAYLITWTPGGWKVFEYSETGLVRVELDQVATGGLPLGGDVEEPRTCLVDARARVGRLVGRPDGSGYRFVRFDPNVDPHPLRPATWVPAVVPRPLRNHGGHVAWAPRIALRPGAEIAELSGALHHLHRLLDPSVGMKAGGWRHSWSPVAATDGVYIHPEHLRGVEAAGADAKERAFLRAGVTATSLFRVRSGTRIRDINDVLWAAGRALPVLGGYDGQTLGGVLTTGTHGSVLAAGPLAELVRSLDLVRFDGGKVRIERASRSLTDPGPFAAARPDWQLVQDDVVFNAVLISMGTMGVVHSLVIDSVERFWMKEVRTVVDWPAVRLAVAGGGIYRLAQAGGVPAWATGAAPPLEGHPRPAYHMEFLWNPYTDKVVITSRHPVDAATRQALEHSEPAWFAHPPRRSLFRVLKLDAMGAEYSRPDLAELATEHFSGALDEIIETVARLRPQLLPGFIDNALGGMADTDGFIQRSYNVFNIGEGANLIPAQSSTLSVPLRDDAWLEAADIIRATARELASSRRQYQTGPISLRFVRGSALHLADPDDVCKFEIIFGGDTRPVHDLAHAVVQAYYEALYQRFGAEVRFHWGQIIPRGTLEQPGTTGHRIRESYPRYDAWRAVRDRLDPSGRGLNAWQRGLLP